MNPQCAPSWSWLPFRAPPRPGRRFPTFLSWGSSGQRCTEMLADRPSAPPSTCSRASTPARCRHRASGSRSQSRTRVPSSRFLTAATDSSAQESRACCIPLPTLGFTAFRTPSPLTFRIGPRASFPQRFSHPSKDSPPEQPRRVATTVASLPFSHPEPPRAFAHRCQHALFRRVPGRSSTSRLFSARESVASNHRCRWLDALSFLGLVPLQGPLRAPRPESSSASSSEHIRRCARRTPFRAERALLSRGPERPGRTEFGRKRSAESAFGDRLFGIPHALARTGKSLPKSSADADGRPDRDRVSAP